MTNSEFKAWFDGFTEAMGGIPNKKQWERVKAQVEKIDGTPITERHYVDRYLPPWYNRPWYPPYYTSYSANSCAAQANVSNNLGMCQGGNTMGDAVQTFNSHTAMYALGQLDAQGA